MAKSKSKTNPKQTKGSKPDKTATPAATPAATPLAAAAASAPLIDIGIDRADLWTDDYDRDRRRREEQEA